MSGDTELRKFLAIVARFDLSDTEVAALTGLSANTARLVRLGRIWPMQPRCRAAIRDFTERHRNAKKRRDLTLPEPSRVDASGARAP
jgi:hypothetical protein